MKKIILGLVSLLTLTTSCSKHDFDGENPYSQANKEATFADDFNSTFGVAAKDYANHDWGMNFIPMLDKTPKATTRNSYPNGNEWASDGYVVPADITDAEREAVLKVFNEKGKEKYQSLVDWDCFFVQQVYEGNKHYTAGNGSDVVGSDHMDYLYTITNKHIEVVSWWPYEEKVVIGSDYQDHIFDFNNSNSNDYGGRMLMVNSNTNVFGYYNSEDSQSHNHFRMEKINGNYYVGFDYSGEGSNSNQQIQRDYIYNDWIVKIVPGRGDVTPPPVEIDYVRVMCEDLGVSHSDFDYNDVVFDVKFTKVGDKITADIILQAAGGTLPLTVGGHEVHNEFGNYPIKTMINTHANVGDHVDGVPPVHFTVTLNGNYSNAHDAINALPVMVRLEGGQVVHLTTNPGSPAEMFAVPVGTDWADERVSIRNKYPMFVDWITNSEIKWYD
jgi:hypothetical protein